MVVKLPVGFSFRDLFERRKLVRWRLARGDLRTRETEVFLRPCSTSASSVAVCLPVLPTVSLIVRTARAVRFRTNITRSLGHHSLTRPSLAHPTITRSPEQHSLTRTTLAHPLYQNGKFVPEKSNIWRDCVDGYYDWVKEHIMEGAPLNEADHCGDPPLLLAAGNGHKAVCELLLDEGADVEQRNVMGESPLIRAAHNGHFHTVKFLVEQAKADVNALDMGDNSALHWAAMRGHVEIVKFLTDQVWFRWCEAITTEWVPGDHTWAEGAGHSLHFASPGFPFDTFDTSLLDRRHSTTTLSPFSARNVHRVPTRRCATSRTRWPSICASRAGPTRTGSLGKFWRERIAGRAIGWANSTNDDTSDVPAAGLPKRQSITLQTERCLTADK